MRHSYMHAVQGFRDSIRSQYGKLITTTSKRLPENYLFSIKIDFYFPYPTLSLPFHLMR